MKFSNSIAMKPTTIQRMINEGAAVNMDNLNLLDIYEIEEYEQQPEEVKQRFRVENLDQANWAMRKLKAVKKQQAEIDTLADNEIQRIKAWQDKEKKKNERTSEFFEFLLTEYLMEGRKTDKKFKVTTPNGSVSTKKQQTKWEIRNEKELIKWLKETGNAKLIRTKDEAALSEIKTSFKISGVNAVDENGEIVPGLYVKEQPDKVIIKID